MTVESLDSKCKYVSTEAQLSTQDGSDSVRNKSGTRKKRVKKNETLLKVVIRRLPPSWTEDDFNKCVTPIQGASSIFFCGSDPTLGTQATSLVYLHFRTHEDVLRFRDQYDGYIFLDAKGQEYPCVVEYAPFQKTADISFSVRGDRKKGTIETDFDYIEFVKQLEMSTTSQDRTHVSDEHGEEAVGATSIVEAMLQEIHHAEKEKNKNKNVRTPLIEFLETKRQTESQEKKEQERIRQDERKRRKSTLTKQVQTRQVEAKSVKKMSVHARAKNDAVEENGASVLKHERWNRSRKMEEGNVAGESERKNEVMYADRGRNLDSERRSGKGESKSSRARIDPKGDERTPRKKLGKEEDRSCHGNKENSVNQDGILREQSAGKVSRREKPENDKRRARLKDRPEKAMYVPMAVRRRLQDGPKRKDSADK